MSEKLEHEDAVNSFCDKTNDQKKLSVANKDLTTEGLDSEIKLSPISLGHFNKITSAGSPLQSTPYENELTNNHPENHNNLPSLTPIRPVFKSKQYNVSSNQSANNTVALAEIDQSFDEILYNQLIIDARLLYKKGNLQDALSKYEEAYNLHEDMKLYKRICKIKEQLKITDPEEEFNILENGDYVLETYNNLVRDAKSHVETENFDKALTLFKEAYEIDPSEKLYNKISKLESDLACDVPEIDDQHYSLILKSAKREFDDKNYQKSYDLYNQANKINPSEELSKKISLTSDYLKGFKSENTAHEVVNKNLSEVKSDVDAYFSDLLLKAKECEESNKLEEAIDYYRECITMKTNPFLVEKIQELEENCNINNDKSQISELNVELYNNLIIKGRELLNCGNLKDALTTYKDALAQNYSEKLVKRIEKIKNKILEDSENDDDNEIDGDIEIQNYYEATITHAREKEENCLFDEAIALYEEANELIPKEDIALKISKLEFKRDSEANDKKVEKHVSVKSSDHEVSSKDKIRYNDLISKGKYAQKDSKIEKALSYYKKALNIYKNEKLVLRINKLQKFLEDEEENEGWYTDLGDGFFLTNEVFDKLYEYQREGVKWMWELYRAEHGGILGDDMGLGKTIQTIVYLQAIFVMEEISSAILVMPLSLVNNWQEEFSKWAPEIRVELFHGTKSERERNVKRVIKKGGVLLTTYGIIEKNVEFLINTSFKWDYLILDEGHKIKNPTKTSKAMRNVPCIHRLLISGTPIQNNLKELWALFDFVSRGKLLGTMSTFKMNYIIPIERGRQKDASKAEARLGTKLAENLRRLIDPFFLRRTKAEIKKKNEKGSAGINNLGKKNELCVWLKLSDGQHNLYKAFLTLDTVRDAMNSSKSPLAALTVLKKICDHPRLAIKFEALREVMDSDAMDMNADDHKKMLSTFELPQNPSAELLQAESCKLRFALQLLEMLQSTGHRTLLFSTSLKILDYIQSMIGDKGIRCLRIDGTINKPGDRQAIIEKFNSDERYSVFLLTTQVGGVGLNLTSADRVIIYDPNWNPATDSQAVDRAYRIGQTKPVIVYRLLTSGTIEEKIYRKQVFKDSITRQATGDSIDPIRYFTNQEISQLFLLGHTTYSETCNQLEELHGAARNHSEQIKTDVREITKLGAIGCSDHDLLFSHEEEVENTPEEKQYVDNMVEQAKRNLALDTGTAPRPNPQFPGQHGSLNNPGLHGYDARGGAVPLGGGQRAPQEPTRGHTMWNTKQTDVETVRKDIEKIDIKESPYFASKESRPGSSKSSEGEVEIIETPPAMPVEVIDIADDDDSEVIKQEKKKLSLSDYKKRQMKIYDYVDSPIQQPHHSIRPSSPVSPVRPRRSVKINVVTPRKSLCNPVGLIIDNHVQLSSPKQNDDDSDEEVNNDLENSRYDNLNQPPCLADSEEDEENPEEENHAEEPSTEVFNSADAPGDDSNSDDESEDSEEKKGQVDALTNMVNTFKFESPSASPQMDGLKAEAENSNPESTKTAKSSLDHVTSKNTDVQNLQSNRTPLQEAKPRDNKPELLKPSRTHSSRDSSANVPQSDETVERTPDMSKFVTSTKSGKENKDNDETNTKKTTNFSGECSCGRAQVTIDKGYSVTKCLCMCSPSDEDKYNKYLERGLEHHKAGNTEKAARYYKAALQYRNDDVNVQKAYMALKRALRS